MTLSDQKGTRRHSMNLLEVNGISKTYGVGETAVHALKNISFSVPKGEFVAVVGESGSGKGAEMAESYDDFLYYYFRAACNCDFQCGRYVYSGTK